MICYEHVYDIVNCINKIFNIQISVCHKIIIVIIIYKLFSS